MTEGSFGVDHVTVAGRLDDVSLNLAPGTIVAVVGGDGAGKSTLMRVLAGALLVDSGRVRTPGPDRVGFVPTGAGFYPDLTVAENLRFAATAYRLGEVRFRGRRDYVLGLTGLGDFTERLAADLSGGMRQKLALALGTLHEPELLVLDEPTTGVDPVSRVDLWRIIADAAAGGVHVVLATSYIDEAERAGHVLALHAGRRLLEGAPSELTTAIPGVVSERHRPEERSRAWRRGTRWHEWTPAGLSVPGDEVAEPDLEDAVIVAALQREAADR
ncbi:MAG: ABC transporter ATP-binding protein [Microthrixaceae bacterium]|nr:ABC transporter ATP-binding protein [Microthrixaceae bacterium]